ncbi:MAG TPA: glycosyltransferase family 39 protein, partial [Vicinamibacterales bacterium]
MRSLVRIHPRAPLFAGLLALATLIFYGLALSRQPIGPDEARVISAAQQLPDAPSLLINTGDRWLQPLHIYATAFAHAIVPGFFAGRWASVAISAINVGLLFLVAWRLFGGYLAAIAAAAVLLLMPAHMDFGRQGIDAISIIPFVLLWLYALLGFLGNDRPAAIALAAAALGAGVYSTSAAPLTMAFLFLTMIVVLWSVGRRKMTTLVTAVAAFVAMLVPLAVWVALNPQTYLDTYG